MKFSVRAIILASAVIVIAGCHTYDNFTTYFNTYYNMQKLIKEAEEEFEFQTADMRIRPRVFVPEPGIFDPEKSKTGVPPFLEEFIVDNKMLQPVKVKLDSVAIKGSKILSYHPKSDYIQGTLYLMALAYFYKSEWLPAEIKCAELVDRFPDGEYAPDALLLQAKTLLIQRKFAAGKLLLSRTVDISWQLERYDILSEAFRLEAELEIFEGNKEGALRPYKQAIAQADDNLLKAKWQADLGILLYRLGWYEKAAKEFALVHKYSPDYMAAFEADLYRANSLARLARYDEAESILDGLESDGNNEEWLGYTYAARMNIKRLQGKLTESGKEEKYADSAYMNHEALMGVYFERAMELFNNNDYHAARKYFAKARNQKTAFMKTARKMYNLLEEWNNKRNLTLPQLIEISKGKVYPDSALSVLCVNLFELGRVHDQLGNLDSALYYYQSAADYSPRADTNTARYLYVRAFTLMDKEPALADSLFSEVVMRYPITRFGLDARLRQEYSSPIIADTAADLFHKGSRDRKDKEYDLAARKFIKIYEKFPQTDHAPRSLYTLGWMFEKDLANIDSALFWYQVLIKEYPQSIYARDIRLSVDYLLAMRSGKPLPDSLKDREKRAKFEPKPPEIVPTPEDVKKPLKDKESGNLFDIFDDPGEYLKKLDPSKMIDDTKKNLEDLKNKALDPSTFKPDIKLPTDMFKDLKKSDDSTKTPPPDIEPVKPK
jgi:TolA-binding protein